MARKSPFGLFFWHEFLTSGFLEATTKGTFVKASRRRLSDSGHTLGYRHPPKCASLALYGGSRTAPYRLRADFWRFLAKIAKKPQKTALAGMAHPPFGRIFAKRDGFLALNEFSDSGRTKKGSKICQKKSLRSLFLARIFDQRPPRFNSQLFATGLNEEAFSDSGHTLGYLSLIHI